MRYLVNSLLLLILVMAGCTGYPRYRYSAADTPPQARERNIDFTTDEYVRFGLILESYLGKPYAGRSRYDPGIDCSLFAQEVFEEYNGTALPRTAAEQYKVGDRIPRPRLRYGDLVFFQTEGFGISHVGIYIGYHDFIHASTSRGVIISSLKETYWAKRYAGGRRILD